MTGGMPLIIASPHATAAFEAELLAGDNGCTVQA